MLNFITHLGSLFNWQFAKLPLLSLVGNTKKLFYVYIIVDFVWNSKRIQIILVSE